MNSRKRSSPGAPPYNTPHEAIEYLSDCAAAFGTRKPMLITGTNIIVAMILIILSLIILSLVAALIARYPFAVAARSPLLFRSNPQPAVSQSVQVHT